MRYVNLGLIAASLLLPTLTWANPATLNHPGRLLASNCFQCHGTDGSGLEHLAGKRASEIVKEIQEMRFESARKEIMNVHAQAYTDQEMSLIADYFSKQ